MPMSQSAARSSLEVGVLELCAAAVAAARSEAEGRVVALPKRLEMERERERRFGNSAP